MTILRAARKFRCVVWLFACLPLAAQSLDLSGVWRKSGDDRPEYAQPAFDDRAWETVLLPWTTRPPSGHYWLRRNLDVPAGSNPAFLTLGPLAEAYELYVNGQRVAAVGSFTDQSVLQVARSRSFPLPANPVAQRLQVALRVGLLNSAPQPLSLFLGGTYAVTPSTTLVADENVMLILRQRTKQIVTLMITAVLFSCAAFFWLLWLADRPRKELAWLGLLAASRGFFHLGLYGAISLNSYPFPAPLFSEFSHDLSGAALAELILVFAGAGTVWLRAMWLRVLFWTCWALQFLLHLPVFYTTVYDLAAVTVLFYGWRRNRHQDSLTWIALALVTLSHANVGGRLFRTNVEVGGYDVNLTSGSLALLSILLVFLSLRRLIADRREKQRLAGELEAARTVQQLLLPTSAARSESFEATAVYEPAQEVGGDFHWSRSTEDGALIVVVGDVSGKGLKAAMLVSVAIGILRNEKSTSPAAILAALNEGLAGHTGGGFVTCCCACFHRSGQMIVANAGHPSPYCDGQEMALEAGLPLGVVPGIVYGETLTSGSQVTLVSDGVIEAENAQRELFGFDRTRAISTKSAREIADAAKAWGQNDDITVVTVRRQG